ncbi:MAG: YbjN domain-containing protein [Rhizobiaceae bacterium]
MRLAEAGPLREAHPLDVIETVAAQHEWSFERAGDDEIAISVSGRLSAYTVSYSWMEDCEALHLACAFDMKVARGRSAEVAKLVALINEQLLMGHFDFWHRENVIMFRQTLVLSGGLDPTERQVEALFDSAVEACDTYFAAFQFVVWSGLTGREAIETVLFETVGNA